MLPGCADARDTFVSSCSGPLPGREAEILGRSVERRVDELRAADALVEVVGENSKSRCSRSWCRIRLHATRFSVMRSVALRCPGCEADALIGNEPGAP
jgi:hypothetical protein